MSIPEEVSCRTCGQHRMCPGHTGLRERLYNEGTFKSTDQRILKTDGFDLGRRKQHKTR